MIRERYELVGLIIFTALAILPSVPAMLLFLRCVARKGGASRRKKLVQLLWATLAAFVMYAMVMVDGFVLEPNWPEFDTVTLSGKVSKPLRILHISDLHIEKTPTRRDQWLVDAVKRLNPDLILLTGDVAQMGNSDVASVRPVLEALQAPLGVFACVGYDSVTFMAKAAPHIRFLCNEIAVLNLGTRRIALAGLEPVGNRSRLYDAIADADYRIVINHTPDLADEAAAHRVDLYCCGHTHGGQVRIPFWGAIITNAESGKRYEAGFYQRGNTTIHTSRGLGLEPPPAVQVRFLCRPEITLITVEPRAE